MVSTVGPDGAGGAADGARRHARRDRGLSARVSALQGKLASAGVVAPTPLEVQLGEVSAKLAAIEQAGLKIGGAVPTYLDTCSKFAAEASRVRNAGRLPFGSDHSKIA